MPALSGASAHVLATAGTSRATPGGRLLHTHLLRDRRQRPSSPRPVAVFVRARRLQVRPRLHPGQIHPGPTHLVGDGRSSIFFLLQPTALACESAKYGDPPLELVRFWPFGRGSRKTAPGAASESIPNGPLPFETAKPYPNNCTICTYSYALQVEVCNYAPFRCHPKAKNFCIEPSHRILRHIHGVLNVDEKKLIAQLGKKSRDEPFEPN